MAANSSEIRALTEAVKALALRTPNGNGSGGNARTRRNRRRRQRRRNAASSGAVPFATAVVQATPGPSGQGRRRRRRRGNGIGAMQSGEVVVSRQEILVTVNSTANSTTTSGNVLLEPSKCNWLSTLAKAFERARWVKIHIYWKTFQAATYGGSVAYGVDWDIEGTWDTRAKVLALTPNHAHGIWVDSTNTPLVLPQNRLQSRLWYLLGATVAKEDKAVATLAYFLNHSSDKAVPLGEFWIDYTIILSGTQVPQ